MSVQIEGKLDDYEIQNADIMEQFFLRYACPYREVAAVLTDIGTEELAHLEMVAAIVHQLTKNLSMEEIEEAAISLARRNLIGSQTSGSSLTRRRMLS